MKNCYGKIVRQFVEHYNKRDKYLETIDIIFTDDSILTIRADDYFKGWANHPCLDMEYQQGLFNEPATKT